MHYYNDTELYQIICNNIKKYRIQAHLTQFQLSERTNLSISYISKIEAAGCHKSMSISALNQISKALNVEISEFFKN